MEPAKTRPDVIWVDEIEKSNRIGLCKEVGSAVLER